MYTTEDITAMSGMEFLAVIDPLSRDELTELLSWFWGGDPAAFAAALNRIASKRQRRGAAPVAGGETWTTAGLTVAAKAVAS